MTEHENGPRDPNEFFHKAEFLLNELGQRDVGYVRALLMYEDGRLANEVIDTIDFGQKCLDHGENPDTWANDKIVEQIGELRSLMTRSAVVKSGQTWGTLEVDWEALDTDDLSRELDRLLDELTGDSD